MGGPYLNGYTLLHYSYGDSVDKLHGIIIIHKYNVSDHFDTKRFAEVESGMTMH